LTKKPVWLSDLSWAGFLLGLAALAGLLQHWPLVHLARQGELPAYLDHVREARRQLLFQGVQTLSLEQTRALHAGGRALFIDVRRPGEFAELHVHGAVNLPPGTWDNLQGTPLEGLAKDRQIVIYCSQVACDDALKAAEKLQAQGFTQVAAFLGGFQAWDEAGYPVDTRF
jgi:rhodanese-related sulfurtransferase